MDALVPEWLAGVALCATPVGSRVTCSPPVTNTDQDVLVLVKPSDLRDVRGRLQDDGYDLCGSEIEDAVNWTPDDERFYSFRQHDVNLIITASEEFHRRFLAASHVAKTLNLLVKADRVMLFQAVLYGNASADWGFATIEVAA